MAAWPTSARGATLLSEADVAAVIERIGSGRVAPSRCGGTLGDYTFRSGMRAGQTFRGCVQFPACDYRIHRPAPSKGEAAAAPA